MGTKRGEKERENEREGGKQEKGGVDKNEEGGEEWKTVIKEGKREERKG